MAFPLLGTALRPTLLLLKNNHIQYADNSGYLTTGREKKRLILYTFTFLTCIFHKSCYCGSPAVETL